MSTQTNQFIAKLAVSLEQIERQRQHVRGGRPMGGLSIPAAYYLPDGPKRDRLLAKEGLLNGNKASTGGRRKKRH